MFYTYGTYQWINLTVLGNVVTHGSIGSSLVEGVYYDLPVYGLSIKSAEKQRA